MILSTDKVEAQTREIINQDLTATEWQIRDGKGQNSKAIEFGVHAIAVREYPANHILFFNRRACGIIEASREVTILSREDDQFIRYGRSRLAQKER